MATLQQPGGTDRSLEGRDAVHAPRGVALGLSGFVVLLVATAVYLIGVRHEALFLDFAGLSGLLFCF